MKKIFPILLLATLIAGCGNFQIPDINAAPALALDHDAEDAFRRDRRRSCGFAGGGGCSHDRDF